VLRSTRKVRDSAAAWKASDVPQGERARRLVTEMGSTPTARASSSCRPGASTSAKQQTETREVLDFFSKQLRGASG
jgi:hypothetical protein